MEHILALQKSLDIHNENIRALEMKLLSTGLHISSDIADIPQQLDDARAHCTRIAEALQRKKAALGVGEHANLIAISKSKFLHLRMNARALKRRIRDRLRQRKFELEKLERAYRHTINGVLFVLIVYYPTYNCFCREKITCSHPIICQRM